jgi:hypothetical protein
MQDPTRDDMLEFLRQHVTHYVLFSSVEDAEFDIEEAIYWFATDYHGGQASNLYSALCQSPFKPGRLQSACSDEASYDLYQDLIEHYDPPEVT